MKTPTAGNIKQQPRAKSGEHRGCFCLKKALQVLCGAHFHDAVLSSEMSGNSDKTI